MKKIDQGRNTAANTAVKRKKYIKRKQRNTREENKKYKRRPQGYAAKFTIYQKITLLTGKK